MNVGNLFPIGTVVTVKDANKSMMIIGVLPENDGKRYDYIAVLYPEGYLTEKQIYLFNHDDVVKVEYLGYMSAEYQVFRQDLEQIMKEVDAEKK